MVNILVVEDTPDFRRQLAEAAQGRDRKVLMAENGEKAISLIEQHDFDVIVTDLKMETDDAGFKVLDAAKKKDIYAQVIMVTAYGTPEISVETMRRGAFDFLERNSPGVDMLEMIRSKIKLAMEFREAKLAKKLKDGKYE